MTFYVHVIVDFIEYMYSNVNTLLAKAEEDIRFIRKKYARTAR